MKSVDRNKLIKFIEVTHSMMNEVEDCNWLDSYKQGKWLQAFGELIEVCYYISNKELYDIGSALQLHMQKMNFKIVKDQAISGDLLWDDGILKLAIKCFEEEEN